MFAIKTSSKIYEPETYKKANSNLVHFWHWKTVIEKEIKKLENHHTYEYNQLPSGRKAVKSK